MNTSILVTTDNKLLERKEVSAEVSFDGATPKRAELKDAVGQKIGQNPELMVLRKVSSNFGRRVVKITVHIYSNKDTLMNTEPSYIKIREGLMQKPEKKKAPTPTKKKKE